MRADAFHYDLPPDLIAQRPAPDRELARLMSLPPHGGAPEHRRVSEFPELLPFGALVVVNDTRVIPARLFGRRRETGGRVEVLLVRRVGQRTIEVSPGDVRPAEVWSALGKGSKALKFGTDIEVQPPQGHAPDLMIRLLGRTEEDGLLEIALWTSSGGPIAAAVRDSGSVPLPPYIKREAEPEDADRYQTVYARHDGAVAAPTAGLHVTNAMIGQLAVRGCQMASITLHVGLGTFRPVSVEDLDSHRMHPESYVISQSTADAVASARGRGAPVVAIGTTTVRALESAADPERPGYVVPTIGETRLLVQPGYRWRIVDGLLTNFHLPRSTLMALVCALGGTDRVLGAYRLAVREGYRFFSYGDAMLLWRSG
ncbi:MAG TPA: tRNA preQ1(34) S-adenosylmethionine ribosyltransferase-isomerase QueA [Polyangiaceae bacterium]|nr:tRNA preQ1(34) S-adenosylmethionine ribosyltransferase-isomerase QueA [Polyangiaceae bacterium]